VCTALLLWCAQKGSVKDVSLISSAESGAVRAHWWLLETEMREPVGCGLWAKHATLGCMRVAVMLTTPVTMRVDIKTHRDSPIQVLEGSCVCGGGGMNCGRRGHYTQHLLAAKLSTCTVD
jgi:hypothetical protein